MGVEYCRYRESGCPTIPVLARPVNFSGMADVECCSFSQRIPGVADSISTIFQPERVPDLLTIEVRDDDAIDTARRLMRLGFPVGPSSGLNLQAAIMTARKLGAAAAAAQIVTVFPDRMERYFTTELFKK